MNQTPSNEYCKRNCKINAHGQSITNVLLSECDLPDEQIAAYIVKKCESFATVVDNQGQLAIHVAAACNRCTILEWLLNRGADVNARDRQLGQTALHRAIQYGNLNAVLLLLRYGARIDIDDRRHKNPAHYSCKPNNPDATTQTNKIQQNKEIFVWGSNRNYNLGLDNKEGKPFPHFLDFFSKQNVFVSSVSLGEYHCLYVTDAGTLYAVGLGDGGRLGTNQENTLCEPQQIVLRARRSETIVCASAARHHSIILTSRNRVLTTGSNVHGQLGLGDVQKSLVFREVDFGTEDVPNRIGVIACKYHSLSYTNEYVHAWGENHGQFGMAANIPKFDRPVRLKTFRNTIVQVVSNNTAICILTNDIILLYAKHTVKSLKKPIVDESIKHIAIRGGDPDEWTIDHEKPSPGPVEVLVVSESQSPGPDSIYLWSYHDQKYVRCHLNQTLSIKHISWIESAVHIISSDGILYRGYFQTGAIETRKFIEDVNNDGFMYHTKRTDINPYLRLEIKISSVPKIDRVCDIAVDEKASSFIALQEDSKKYVDKPTLPIEPMSLKELLLDTSEDDKLHDIVFHVENEIFPAHRFVIFSRAKGLRDLILKTPDQKHIRLEYKYLTAGLFHLILKYIYADYTCTVADIEKVESSFNPHCGLTSLDVCSRIRELMGLLGVSPMFDRLPPGDSVKHAPMRFDRHDHPDLYDITIECADNKYILAHRCILTARLEYFNMMLNNDWTESTQSTIKIDVPVEYMTPLIDYLYNDDFGHVRKQQYKNIFICHLMETCDRFFATKLKDFCEISLIEKMHAKNCIDMLELAMVYNATFLETAALQYISHNLGRLLENQLLFSLNVETLEKLSEYYHKVFAPPQPNYTLFDKSFICGMHRTEMINKARILSFIGDFKVDLSPVDDAAKSKASKSSRAKRSERTKVNERLSLEKEALKMTKRMLFERAATSTPRKPDDAVITEAAQIAQEHSSGAKKWMTVPEKKDVRKKLVIAGIKSNEVLRNEPREQEQFTPLKAGTPPKSAINGYGQSPRLSVSEEASSPSAPNLSLIDFAPQKSQKISQKQRRRQLSQSEAPSVVESVAHSPVNQSVWAPMTSTPAEHPLNPWKRRDSQESGPWQPMNEAAGRPSTGSTNGSASSKRLFSPPSKSNKPTASTNCSEIISLNEILADQRQQKVEYIRMTNKSLQLTQTEEKAIDELNAFYNVDNVYDEHIVIERVPKVIPTINFAQWRQQ